MKNGVIMAILLVIWGAIKAFFKLLKAIIQVLSSLIVFLGLYIPLFYIFFGLILLATTDFTFGTGGTNQLLYFIGLGLCCVAALIISIRNLLVRPIATVFAPLHDYAEERRAQRRVRDDDRYPEDREEFSREREEGARGFAPRGEYVRRDIPRYADPRRDAYYGEPASYPYRGRDYEDAGYGDPYGYQAPPPSGYRRDYEEPIYDRHTDYRDEHAPASFEPERPLIYYSRRRPGVLVKEYTDRFELYQEDSAGRHFIGTEYKDE